MTATVSPPAPSGSPGGTPAAGSAPAGSTRSAVPPTAARGPRRARLTLRRIDPWSVLKFSLLFSLCLLVVFVVAVAALYAAVDAMGVFDAIDRTATEVADSDTSQDLQGLLRPGRIIGAAALLGTVNAVLVTALATLSAFLYNLCADLVGGIAVTLSESD